MLEDCAALPSCFGNNASTPYLLFSVPPHPDHPDGLPPAAVGEVPGVPDGMSAAAFLDEGEVLLVRGVTPPPAQYFGLSPYLFSRVDGTGTRVTTFASLGDTLNQVVIAEGQGSAFDAEVAVLMSSDDDALAAARSALEAEGTPPDAIHTLALPRDVLRQGQAEDADTFLLLGRLALPDDAEAGAAYLDDPPLEVLRLTPEGAGLAVAVPERAARGDGADEAHLQPALDALRLLTAPGPRARAGGRHLHRSSPCSSIPRGAEDVSECLGDNSDTTYAAGPIDVARGDGTLTLGPNDALYAYGVNHVAAGKATYANLSVYTQTQREGVLAVDDRAMAGTAEPWLPDHPDVDQLWVVEIRRDCAGRAGCVALPTDFPGVPLDESLFFIFRAYLNPGQTVSADHSEILTERVLLVRDAP